METLPQILEHAVRRFGDRPALRRHGGPEEQAFSYRRLGWTAAGMARRLAARGIGKGQPVALLADNGPEWAVAYLAIHLLGGVCVPLDTALGAEEIRSILGRSRPRLLIAARAFLEVLGKAGADGPGRPLAVLEELAGQAAGAGGDRAAGDSAAVWQQALAAAGQVRGDDPAVVVFSSGTTGQCKGIVLSHRNLASNAAASASWLGIRPEDRFLSVLPLNHTFEQTAGLLAPLVSGASVVYAGSLNPRVILEAMRQWDVTLMAIVPAVARLFHKKILSSVQALPAWKRRVFRANLALARAGRRLGLNLGQRLFAEVHRAFGGHLRFLVSGGAALDPSLAEFFLDLGIPLLQGYGLTETSPVVSCNRLGDHVVGSVGRPLPGAELRIDAPPSPRRAAGEILVRGPNVMAGYFQDPASTAEAIQDGWLRTGDVGWMDPRGRLYIAGRIKDVIIGESGKNIYPAEIEAELAGAPCFREVCVIALAGGRTPQAGEEPLVLVVPNEELTGSLSAEQRQALLLGEVRRRCRRLAGYKQPRHFAIWPGEFPRTRAMKIRKQEIRARLGELRIQPLC